MKKSVYPIRRIEGHADIELVLDGAGRLESLRLLVGSFRGFEKILVGRPIEEVPRIVTRICGLCPWSHHLASIKAIEDALGIVPPPRAEALRRLSFLVSHIQDKILHFFMLSLPDFLALEQGREVHGLGDVFKHEPKMAQRALEAKRICFDLLELLGGKAIHPVSMVIGGVMCPPGREEVRAIRRQLKRLLDFSSWALDAAKERFFIPLKDEMLDVPLEKTGFMGTVDTEGWLELYQGNLRLIGPQGEEATFSPREYEEYLEEEEVEWSYSKLVKTALWHQPDGSKGIYRVNALSRLLASKGPRTQRAQGEYAFFRDELGESVWHPMNYHWARLIEMLYCAEEAYRIVEDSRDILASGEHVDDRPWKDREVDGLISGIGCLEAPRGTLIHHYEIHKEKGLLRRSNLIVGTTHNIAPMAQDAFKIADEGLRAGEALERVRHRIFMVIRAHDP